MMEELDLLKKDWKKNENSFQQVSELEIYKMIHKKSSSIVKWILIISILEFTILNGYSLLVTDKNFDLFISKHPYLNILNYINYVIILGFIFLFYRNYKTISALSSSKTLIENILKTRKTVTYYIIWNVIIGSLFGAFAVVDGFTSEYIKVHSDAKIIMSEQIALIIFLILFISGIIWLFYKLIYGRLLNKLNKNYKELKKIDL